MTGTVIDVNNASFDCFFIVLINFDNHILFGLDIMQRYPSFNFVQPFSCSHSADQLISHT
jgi:hypothetical protein